MRSVSYTHLDVYKRQAYDDRKTDYLRRSCWLSILHRLEHETVTGEMTMVVWAQLTKKRGKTVNIVWLRKIFKWILTEKRRRGKERRIRKTIFMKLTYFCRPEAWMRYAENCSLD